MRAILERTGGFAGMRLTATADTDMLSDTDAEQLRQLVNGANFFALPELIVPQQPQPDRFQYTVTIEDEGRTHTVTASEAAIPASMRPLTDFLARQGRRAA